eukprot:PRCOL_00000509-RA
MSEEEASPVEKTAAGDGSSDGTAIGNGAAERALAVKGNGCEVTTSEGGEAKGDADKASDGGAPTGGLAQTFDLFSFASMFRYTDRADALLMAIGTVGALANGMGLPLFSLIFGDLLDSLNDTLDVRSAVDDKVKWLGILAGGTLVAGWAQIAFWTLAGERLMGHVREEYLKAALRQDARYYDVVSPPGDTFAALGPDVASMTEAVGQNVGLAIQYVTTFIAGLIIGFIRGWRVALVVLAFIPLFILVLAVLGTVLMGAAKKSSEAYASAASIANNALCSIREVLSATAHEFLNASYNDALAPAVRSDRTEGITRGAIWGGFFFLMFATYGSVLWIAAVFVRDGHMSGGEVVTAFFAVMIGGIILGQLAPIASSMLGGIPAARRLYALIDRTPDIDVYGPGETPQEVAAELKLTDVRFAGSAYASLVQLQQVMFSDSERTFSEPSKAGSKYDVDAPNAKKGDHDASVDASLKSIAVVPSLATDPDQEDVTRGRASSGNGVSPQAADAPVSTPVGNGGASSELRPTSTDNDAASAAAADDAGPRYSLVRFVLPEWKYGLVGFVAAGCIGAAFPVFGLLLSEAINVYYLPDSSQMVSEAAKWGGILIGLGGGLFIAASMANGATGIGGGRLTMRVRKEVFAHMLRQEVSWFDTHQTAEMASQLEADAKAVQVLAGQRVGILIQGLVTLVVGMVLALTAGWQLALVVMALFPLLGFAGYLEMQTMGKNLMDNKGAGKTLDDFAAEEAGEREAAHGMATSAGRPGLVASEAILNVRTVASSTAEESIAIAYRSALSGPRRAAYRNAQIAGGGYGLCYAIIFGAYALAFWYGGVLVDEGKLTFQQVLEVFFALVISATTIAQSQALLPDWAKTDAAVKNIFELLNRRSKIDPESSFGLAITDRDDMRGSLQLRDGVSDD